MTIAALVTWLITVSIGAYMLRTWIARGGPQMQRVRGDGLPPVVVYGHASLALTGLAVWISYVVSGIAAIAWSAALLLMPVIGLGLAMVTVWTPYPVPAAAGTGPPSGMLTTPAEDALAGRLTDELLARALTDDALAGRLTEDLLARVPADASRTAGKRREHLAPLLPAFHGVAALTTLFLATLTAVSAR
jgi:manganese efflux pump family protein